MSHAVVPDKLQSAFVDIAWRQRRVRIEHRWLNADRTGAPLMVFLHEGLGSVAMWKDFPQRLCSSLGCRGLVYSRPGYGQSTPRPDSEVWHNDFMHHQALEVLPALMQALNIDDPQDPPWLFGHSDGASIALLAAAHRPDHVAGVVALAPHIFVEDVALRSIEQARQAYEHGKLQEGLARYHDDPDSAFWGWNRIWLEPGFRSWTIEDEMRSIRCPVLAVQGHDDEYGTLGQIRGVVQRVPGSQLLALPACGHWPHRDQPEALISAVATFFSDHPHPSGVTP